MVGASINHPNLLIFRDFIAKDCRWSEFERFVRIVKIQVYGDTPAGYAPAGKYAAVVVAHPNGGSKDQVAGLYAQKLAEAGLVTIAFDARYQGESGGMPRRTDKPANRMGDIMGAVDFIQNYPGVDPERIGAFGICGGGGYTFATAQVDKRIKAVGTLHEFPDDLGNAPGIIRADERDFIRLIDKVFLLELLRDAHGRVRELTGHKQGVAGCGKIEHKSFLPALAVFDMAA